MNIINLTPWSAQPLVGLDLADREALTVVVKATFGVSDGRARAHDEQAPVLLADAYHGEPDASSIRDGADTALVKPATDVVLTGSAYTSRGTKHWVDVRLRFGPLQKWVRVFGDRRWRSSAGVSHIDAPEPFDRMPLAWERAYGGTDASVPDAPEAEPRNPVGVGFRGRKSALPLAGAPLPNLEDPYQAITAPNTRPAPAGFGFIAPGWQPRSGYVGTYDAAWQSDRAPLLPRDFDPRFFQVAPADQIYAGEPEPGLPVEVDNASPGGRLAFTLPAVRPTVRVRIGDDDHPLPLRCDTVVIDGDTETLMLAWRGAMPLDGRLYAVEWIRIDETQYGRRG